MNESPLDDVFSDDWPEDHRSGVVAVVGRPNAGKSTLINRVLGEKIAIVSPKPQTTRRQQLGIFTREDVQLLFVDTPGLHKPQHKLGEYMVRMAQTALRDADVVLWIIDVAEPPHVGDKFIAEMLQAQPELPPVVIVLNKLDRLESQKRRPDLAAYVYLSAESLHPVSALNGQGVPELLAHLIGMMPLGPRYFPVDQLSEVTLRYIASETIREKVMLHTEQEVPHAVAVEIDSYREREDGTHFVSATLYVERESQKGIVIGKGGAMIKRIGTEAREELARLVDAPVYIDLHVKVLKNWRSSDHLMQRLGYRVPKDEDAK